MRTAIVMAALVAVIYALRIDEAAGLIVDDAWYIVLAKALAQGDGYRLISSATTEIMPSVPPGFPALLSLVFFVTPDFPGNLPWLKLVSIAAMLGVAVVCWIDFTRHRGVPRDQAVWLAAATAITPALVFLATSTVMSDSVFLFAQVLTVLLVERAAREGSHGARAAVIAGVAAAATMLIRSAGVAVVAAAVAYFVISKKPRHAGAFIAAAAICILPWQLYASAHAPAMEESMAHGGTIAYSYQQLLAMDRPGDLNTGDVAASGMAGRIGRNLARVAASDVGAVLVPSLYRGPSESGQEVVSVGGFGVPSSMGSARGTMIVSVVLCLVIVAGCIGSFPSAPSASSAASVSSAALPALLIGATVAMISVVGSQTFRYVAALTPFLIYFLWRGLRRQAAARIVLLSLIGLNLMDHAMYLRLKMTGTPEWIADAREIDAVLTWMSANLTEPGAVASTNPGLVYLHTGRKAIVSAGLETNWDTWKRSGVRYVVALRRRELPGPAFKARLLFETGRRRLWVVEMY